MIVGMKIVMIHLSDWLMWYKEKFKYEIMQITVCVLSLGNNLKHAMMIWWWLHSSQQ